MDRTAQIKQLIHDIYPSHHSPGPEVRQWDALPRPSGFCGDRPINILKAVPLSRISVKIRQTNYFTFWNTMNIDTAKLIVETLEDNNRRLGELLLVLKTKCDPEELDSFRREIGRAIVGIDQHLYPLILQQYPELNPLKGNGASYTELNTTKTPKVK